MTLAVEKLGTRLDPVIDIIDLDRAKAYAAATNDDNPAYATGKYAPPVFGDVIVWGALMRAMTEVMSPEAFLMQVHGEQDMNFHKPLVPGMQLTSRAEPYSVRVGTSGTRYTVRITSVDDAGNAVMEQYATFFIRGMTEGPSAGPDKPDHVFPEAARSRRIGEYTSHVDGDQTYRYRDASGDPNPVHLDEASAKAVGLPGIIVHGLCTMAMTGRAIVETVAGGDPSRLTRLAVRFSKNVFPGSDLVTHIYDAGERDERHVYAFEAVSLGQVVISNGRAEVMP